MGLLQNDIAKNFVTFTPRRETLQISFKIKRNEQTDNFLEESELDQLTYDNQWAQYRIRVKEKDILESKEKIVQLLKVAYQEFTGKKLIEEVED